MPSLGFGEMIVILLVALIVFGPKRLPEIGRTLGRSVREFRRATANLKAEFEDTLDDEEAPPSVPSPQQPRRAPEASGDGQRDASGEPSS